MNIFKRRRGFANPEYQILIAVLCLLAAIIIPQIARVRERARNFAALAQVRGAIEQYAKDHGKKWPADLDALTVDGRYLKDLPLVSVMNHHSASRQVDPVVDFGGWGYDATRGAVWINCTHTDSRGKAWSDY